MISRNTIDKIRLEPILGIVRNYIADLKKAGSSWRCKSPWTGEKTGSFYVVPHKNIFKDFSSGLGGDAIKFVMEFKKISYVEAIREICKDVGITIEEDNVPGQTPEEKDFKDELYLINRAAAKRYADNLWPLASSLNGKTTHPAIQEVINREFTPDTVLEWQLGYAPDEWNYLSKVMIDNGKYSHGIELGLIKTKGERTYDTFRHRLIFPIQDERGHIVAFGGRSLPGAVKTASEGQEIPKYINSPESKIYDKSRVLYGLFQAMPAIRKTGHACLVEGYTDVISFHRAGIDNTVGSCGTALTEEQCALLKRYTEKVVIFYDPDAAGRRATMRAVDMLLLQGIETHVTVLPDGKDPDDFVRMFKEIQEPVFKDPNQIPLTI